MAALPDNDRIAGPFIATAGQTAFPADFPLIRLEALRLRIRRGAIYLPIEAYPDVDAADEGEEGFTANRAIGCLAGDQVWVYSELAPQRLRQHTPNGAVRSTTLEADAVELQAQLQEHRRDLGLTMSVLPGDTPPTPESLAAAAEAGQIAQDALEQVGDRITKDKYPVIRDLSLEAGDGVTDCSALLKRTDVAFLTLPPGDYRVKADCTITRPLYFAPGSRMTIDAGVTVTFSGRGQVTSDCRRQIFYGTGAVLGLRQVDETWFVGDKIYALDFDYVTHDVTTPLNLLGPNADAELQRAANAVRENGKYLCHSGVLSMSGAVSIAFNRQVEITGDVRTSLYMWTSLKTNGFAINKQRSKIDGVWFRKYAMDAFATEGVGIYITASQVIATNYLISGAFVGVQQINAAGGFFDTFEIHNARSAGFSLVNVNDTVVHGFIINAGSELAVFTGGAGGWNPIGNDELVGATSGCRFIVRHQTAAGGGTVYLTRFYQNAKLPVIGETFTCQRNGATAVLSSYDQPHSEAGMKLEQTGFDVGNFMEGTFVSSGDIIGGFRSLLILGAGVGYRQGPSFNNFTAVFFDSALAEGVKLDKTDGARFTACWIASRYNGFNIQDARQISFNGCEIRDSDNFAGVIAGLYSTAIDFTDCAVVDNRAGVDGTTGTQVSVAADYQGTLTIKGGRWGKSVSTRHSTDTAINFLGATAKLVATGVTFRSTRQFPIGGLFGLPQYWVQGCDGARVKSRNAGTILTGQSSVTLAHGLPFTPDPSVALVSVNSGNGWGGGGSAYVSATTATTYTVTLLDKDGNVFVATKNMNFLCTFDQSFNAIN